MTEKGNEENDEDRVQGLPGKGEKISGEPLPRTWLRVRKPDNNKVEQKQEKRETS